MDEETKVPNLITVIKNNPVQIISIDAYDQYSYVGATYRTFKELMKKNIEQEGEHQKIDILEKNQIREFQRLREAFSRVPYSKDIPIKGK